MAFSIPMSTARALKNVSVTIDLNMLGHHKITRIVKNLRGGVFNHDSWTTSLPSQITAHAFMHDTESAFFGCVNHRQLVWQNIPQDSKVWDQIKKTLALLKLSDTNDKKIECIPTVMSFITSEKRVDYYNGYDSGTDYHPNFITPLSDITQKEKAHIFAHAMYRLAEDCIRDMVRNKNLKIIQTSNHILELADAIESGKQTEYTIITPLDERLSTPYPKQNGQSGATPAIRNTRARFIYS